MAYESLIEDCEIVQGDSSDIYMFGESTGATLDADWEASFTIIAAFGDSPVIERTLPKDGTEENFVFQIYPVESAQLTAGVKYIVGVEIRNTTLNYNAEVAQFKMKVLSQAVV